MFLKQWLEQHLLFYNACGSGINLNTLMYNIEFNEYFHNIYSVHMTDSKALRLPVSQREEENNSIRHARTSQSGETIFGTMTYRRSETEKDQETFRENSGSYQIIEIMLK